MDEANASELSASPAGADLGGGYTEADFGQAPEGSSPEPASQEDEAAAESTNEGEQSQEPSSRNDDPVERRVRSLQAAKDKEIARLQKEHQETVQANEMLQNLIFSAAVQNARQQGDEAQANTLIQQFQLLKAQQRLNMQAQQLQQRERDQGESGAVIMAHELARDPRYKGVKAEELLEWAPYGREAMERYAAKLSKERIKTQRTERVQSKSDSMGGTAGAGGTKYDNLSGGDLIGAALRDKTDRRKR